MNPGRGGVSALLKLLACGTAALVAPSATPKNIATFSTELAVRWGAGAGSDAFRVDLSRSLAEALATRCFTGVVTAGVAGAQGTDLVFDVVLSDAVDETLFDDSIAGALQPGDPGNELRRVTRFEVSVDATLTSRATRAVVIRKHFAARVSRRPLYLGEDAHATARAEAIEDIVRDLCRGLGCGGAKLERKIREALGNTAPAASAPR